MGCQVPWAFADRPHGYGLRESGVHVAGGEGGLLTDHDNGNLFPRQKSGERVHRILSLGCQL